MTRCQVSENTAVYSGGAIYAQYDYVILTACTFTDNSAQWGGAIYHDQFTYCNYSDSLFSGNRAFWGAAIYHWHAYGWVDSCTMAENTGPLIVVATSDDPEWPEPSELTVYSSILISETSVLEVFEGTGTCQIEINTSCLSHYPSGASVYNSIYDDPQFIDAAAGDFRLQKISPCIDTGSGSGYPLDIAGRPRVWDGDCDGIADADMGAYEFGLTGDLLGDCRVHFGDFAVLASWWLEDCVEPAYCDLVADIVPSGKVDYTDLAAFADHWLDSLLD